ncbi:MAG: UDP-2,3-diacylglucosamine hydrolase [Candidatus Cloacimonadota bacterium]|nr:MAG: UDP-2,3-diacylglucosamine hydrolase [Candidatus Cloacimonadota bacterium]
MRVYFASDFHLKFIENQEDKERREKVISFLDSLVGNADLLVLNGDVFDLWFTWNTVMIKGYFPILKKLADISESGCRIVFTAGNHDFWFRDFLADYLDIELFEDSFSEVIDGKSIYVTHGDLYTKNDFRYKLFRSLVRNKIVMKIFGCMHPDFALNIGRSMSRSSRKRKVPHKLSKKREQGLIDFAKKKLNECDIVVMGHSHIPRLEKFDNGIYANAGDWVQNSSYLKMIDGKIELLNYYTI